MESGFMLCSSVFEILVCVIIILLYLLLSSS